MVTGWLTLQGFFEDHAVKLFCQMIEIEKRADGGRAHYDWHLWTFDEKYRSGPVRFCVLTEKGACLWGISQIRKIEKSSTSMRNKNAVYLLLLLQQNVSILIQTVMLNLPSCYKDHITMLLWHEKTPWGVEWKL